MSETSNGTGKVVVNRTMSLDGFIAGPGDTQDWIFDFIANDAPWQTEAAAATGAMLVGRRTVEVGERMEGREPGVALDAACGTGRFAEFLSSRGHRVIGLAKRRISEAQRQT
jgi:hypothetical protein